MNETERADIDRVQFLLRAYNKLAENSGRVAYNFAQEQNPERAEHYSARAAHWAGKQLAMQRAARLMEAHAMTPTNVVEAAQAAFARRD